MRLTDKSLFASAVGFYGLYSLLVLISLALDLERLLFAPFFLWPYPFLLSLQELLPEDPASASSWIGGVFLGATIVLGAAWVTDKSCNCRWKRGLRGMVLGPLLAAAALGTTTLLAFLLASMLGWPTGE